MNEPEVPTVPNSDRYRALSIDRLTRAARIRERVLELDDTLAPLQLAMKRRASELELAGTAMRLIAEGQSRIAAA